MENRSLGDGPLPSQGHGKNRGLLSILTACANLRAPTNSAMAILSDRWIREAARTQGMIEPFVEAQRRDGCISYGLSSYGYDARVAPEFKIFTNIDSTTVDPKDRKSTRLNSSH